MTSDYVSQKVLDSEYAVRGAILIRAEEIEKDLKAGKGSYPFTKIQKCNQGNPQLIGQKPISFFRYVMALIDAPFLLENEKVLAEFPPDAVARAKKIMAEIGPTTGAYTGSKGFNFARRDVADYITERDRQATGNPNLPSVDIENVYMTEGSSPGVKMILQLVLDGEKDTCMIPIPQYPLYSAVLTIMGAGVSPYYLDEKTNWGLSLDSLSKCYNDAVAKNSTPRILVVVNPGNPTGQILEKSQMIDIIKFAHDHKIILLADEVYQANVYEPEKHPFYSFRAVALEMDETYAKNTMIVSLHTVSKGMLAECGRRGGYFELLNIPQVLNDQLLKMAAINLCANVNGQLMTALMCQPPKKGDHSYDSYIKEHMDIYHSLQQKATLVANDLNTIEGFSCTVVDGAMYAYPQITIPKGYVTYNAELNAKDNTHYAPDTRWCLEFLERTGFVLVAGSGFGQEEGTFHFRTTILPPVEEMKRFTEEVRKFQGELIAKYSN